MKSWTRTLSLSSLLAFGLSGCGSSSTESSAKGDAAPSRQDALDPGRADAHGASDGGQDATLPGDTSSSESRGSTLDGSGADSRLDSAGPAFDVGAATSDLGVDSNAPVDGDRSVEAGREVERNEGFDAGRVVTGIDGGGGTGPGAPTEVAATLGDNGISVVVTFLAPEGSSSSPISSYRVISSPSGLTASGAASPIMVTSASSVAGYAFAVAAINSVGTGAASAAVHVVTSFGVIETFHEPETQPNDSIFTGTFTLDSTTRTVSDLAGSLTESMTGTPMATVPLTHQLSVLGDGLGGNGLLVTTFYLATTNTFATGLDIADPVGGAFSPAYGVGVGGIYYGWPAAKNPSKGGVGNAYAVIDVNIDNPLTPASQSVIDRLAYADCTTLGMMGAVCMTGTSKAGHGAVGTMSGYPVSQVITKR